MKIKQKKIVAPKKVNIVKQSLELISDDDSQREINISMCDDGSWNLWSYDRKATYVMEQLQIPMTESDICGFYCLSWEEVVNFIQLYSNTSDDYVSTMKEKRDAIMAAARNGRNK